MNTNTLVRWIIVFAAFAAAGISMLVIGVRSPNPEIQAALPLVGTALLSSGLTFFLVKMVGADEAGKV